MILTAMRPAMNLSPETVFECMNWTAIGVTSDVIDMMRWEQPSILHPPVQPIRQPAGMIDRQQPQLNGPSTSCRRDSALHSILASLDTYSNSVTAVFSGICTKSLNGTHNHQVDLVSHRGRMILHVQQQLASTVQYDLRSERRAVAISSCHGQIGSSETESILCRRSTSVEQTASRPQTVAFDADIQAPS